jgi:hypothetical protein
LRAPTSATQCRGPRGKTSTATVEKHPFIDKQSQIAERKRERDTFNDKQSQTAERKTVRGFSSGELLSRIQKGRERIDAREAP